MENAHPQASMKAPATPPATEPPKPAEKPAAGAPATGKPAGAAPQVKSDPAKLRRRIIWTCIWGYIAANFLMFLRYFFPRAIFEPSTVFRIGYPSDFSLGVDERFKQQRRIWVVRDATRLYVIFARCTHLGCTPDWKQGENKFKCPCHGSGYTPEGVNFEGPAPRPMDRANVEISPEGQIVVDTAKLYTVAQFNEPNSYISV